MGKLESHQPTGDNSTKSNLQQNGNNSVKSHDPKDATHQADVKNNSDDQDNTDTQYGLRTNSFDYVPLDNETYEKEYSDNIDSTNKTSVILGDKDYSELENSIFGDNNTPKESSIPSVDGRQKEKYRDSIRNDDIHLNEVIDEADKDHASFHDDEGKERDESHKLPKNEEEDKIGNGD